MKTNDLSDFRFIEKKLDEILKPVLPEESYSENLKKRLINNAAIIVEKADIFIPVMKTLAFLFLGFVFIWVIINVLLREGKSSKE
jgi:hypothetical protein